jgi:hypothetical protein
MLGRLSTSNNVSPAVFASDSCAPVISAFAFTLGFKFADYHRSRGCPQSHLCRFLHGRNKHCQSIFWLLAHRFSSSLLLQIALFLVEDLTMDRKNRRRQER